MKIKHIVALSGGKDSTALALRLLEVEPRDYIYFCTPTGDELPPMKAHWKKIEKILGKPIIYLRNEKCPTIYDLIKKMNMLPNWRARFCTRLLKIEVAQKFYKQFEKAIIYVGLRADEKQREGINIYDDNIEQRYPLREWGWRKRDVYEYLGKCDVDIPKRTDCAMCFYQKIGEWWNLWKDYNSYFLRIETIENEMGHTLLSPGKWDNWPHKLSDLRTEFAKGRVPKNCDSNKELLNEEKCLVCSI